MQEHEVNNLMKWLHELDTTPVSFDRHLLLEQIVILAYKYRYKDQNMHHLAECIGWMHLNEFDDLRGYIPINADDHIFPSETFPKLATLLTEAGRYQDAIEVCQRALAWGLDDGTKSGYQGRIERIERQAEKGTSTRVISLVDCNEIIRHVQIKLKEIQKQIDTQRKVPVLDVWQTELSEQILNETQREFYTRWVLAWKQGMVVDIECQVGYVFLYIQSELLRRISEDTITELLLLREQYGADQPDDLRRLRYYCGAWASDCCVYLGQFRRAIEIFPELYINHLLSLKILLDEDLSGNEVLRLFGQTSLTAYGKKHIEDITVAIEDLLPEYRDLHGASIIQQWADRSDTQKYRLFNSSSRFREVRVTAYRFEESLVKESFVGQFKDLIREAENRVRETQGIARIGEGWVSETELYYQIEQAFPYLEVLHHASPEWLDKQHLDIYLPQIKTAIEYQGKQHDDPIEFFGGEKAFVATQERDARKRALCEQHGVCLIEVRPDYSIDELIRIIRDNERP